VVARVPGRVEARRRRTGDLRSRFWWISFDRKLQNMFGSYFNECIFFVLLMSLIKRTLTVTLHKVYFTVGFNAF
jgi:hypothetical protein